MDFAKGTDRSVEREDGRGMLKVGIVGLGLWGTELAEAMQKLPQRVEIAACASREPADAAAFAGRFGGQACEDFKSVLAPARTGRSYFGDTTLATR